MLRRRGGVLGEMGSQGFRKTWDLRLLRGEITGEERLPGRVEPEAAGRREGLGERGVGRGQAAQAVFSPRPGPWHHF